MANENRPTFTPFTVTEMNRLVNLIPQTDPRTMEYAELLANLERYCSICTTVDSIIFGRGIDGYVEPEDHPVADSPYPDATEAPKPLTFAEPVKEEPEADPPEAKEAKPEAEAVTYDAATVKKALVNARKNANLNIAQWLRDNFHVDGFQNLPETEYDRAMQLLSEIV